MVFPAGRSASARLKLHNNRAAVSNALELNDEGWNGNVLAERLSCDPPRVHCDSARLFAKACVFGSDDSRAKVALALQVTGTTTVGGWVSKAGEADVVCVVACRASHGGRTGIRLADRDNSRLGGGEGELVVPTAEGNNNHFFAVLVDRARHVGVLFALGGGQDWGGHAGSWKHERGLGGHRDGRRCVDRRRVAASNLDVQPVRGTVVRRRAWHPQCIDGGRDGARCPTFAELFDNGNGISVASRVEAKATARTDRPAEAGETNRVNGAAADAARKFGSRAFGCPAALKSPSTLPREV